MIQQKVTIELQNLFLQSIIDSQLYLVTLVIYILMPFDKVKDIVLIESSHTQWKGLTKT